MQPSSSHREYDSGGDGSSSRSNSSSHSPQPKQRRQWTSRGKGLRTRSGCTNCRTRRVKCSETKPACTACERRKEQCVYDRDRDSRTPQAQTEPQTQTQKHARGPRSRSFRSQTEARRARRRRVQHGEQAGLTSTQESAARPAHADSRHDHGREPTETACANQDTSQDHSLDAQHGAAADDYTLDDHANYTHTLAPTSGTASGHLDDASPESSWSNPPLYSAETASRLWLDLLANDAGTVDVDFGDSLSHQAYETCLPSAEQADALIHGWVSSASPSARLHDSGSLRPPGIELDSDLILESMEIPLFQHFVSTVSAWIDVTDPCQSFAVQVASMALRDLGLMKAILALSARHLSVCSSFPHLSQQYPSADTLAVKYYHQALQFLQVAMQHQPYLRSEQLLATVLLISKYEMLDTNGPDWERHLKGVFWIQRSQTIHGESAGLKQAIWWAWLRQDIWAAFKDRRKILSFYVLKNPCSELDFWQLVNRSVFLLGQCVSYVSQKEIDAGTRDVQARMSRGQALLASLDEWATWFAQHDRRLPVVTNTTFPFRPIWINPPAASLAVQVHHFARMLLNDFMPALGGLAELEGRRAKVQSSAGVICGIAYCTTESAPMIVSTQCLYAMRTRLSSREEIDAVNELLLHHQQQTGWPNRDIHAEVHENVYGMAAHAPSST